MNRSVASSTRQASREIRDLVQSALAAELLRPSGRAWLVSAWITDAHVLDNSAGEFASIVPAWPEREISLSEVIGAMLSLGTRFHVVTNAHPANAPFARALKDVASRVNASSQFRISDLDLLTTSEEDGLHRKRLVTENFMIWGSMNFTRSGMQRNAEDVSLEVDVARVAAAISEMEQLYGPGMS